MNKVVNPLYKLLPSKKLNLGGKNGATDLHPMASDFFFEFKKIRISVREYRDLVHITAAIGERCIRIETHQRERYLMKRLFTLTLLLVCLLLAGCGSTTATKEPVPTQQAMQAQPTLNPTSTPMPSPILTPEPTPTPTISGSPILGADIRTFISKYGEPNDHSSTNTGSYHFQRYSDSNVDFLIIQTDTTDGDAYTQKVEIVTAQASNAGSDTGWSQQQANTTCSQFLPSDAIYKNQVPLSSGGYDKIYYSTSLASVFPASAFIDANQKQVQAGLFDVQYLTKSASGSDIDSCSILIDTQQNQ